MLCCRSAWCVLLPHSCFHAGPAPAQRLLGATFKLDIEAGAREYCEAEEAWAPATALLGSRGGAGWGLLQAMLAPDWRARPSAAQCLQHPFFSL